MQLDEVNIKGVHVRTPGTAVCVLSLEEVRNVLTVLYSEGYPLFGVSFNGGSTVYIYVPQTRTVATTTTTAAAAAASRRGQDGGRRRKAAGRPSKTSAVPPGKVSLTKVRCSFQGSLMNNLSVLIPPTSSVVLRNQSPS